MKQKRKKKSHKKNRIGKILFFLILSGILVTLFFLFRQEIFDSVKPWFEKRGILREKRGILLYFSDGESEYLIGEKREILKRDEVEEEAKDAINELIKGPKGKLIPTLPPQTKLLGLELGEDGVAKINFNRALSKDHPGGSSAEMMTLYSIVNSLTLNFSQIKRVQILIEGKAVETIAGHLSLRQPVLPKPDLIRRQ
ncbi:MAG: GerMN domain-containing protein [Desulfobacterales bacterium]|nr:GerMN domain-containing protein [Desulfobacterales bacterium]